MGKFVILKIAEGDFERGFPVTLQIGEEGERPFAETDGSLPPAPDITEFYDRWQSAYRDTEADFRIKPLVKGQAMKPGTLLQQCRQSADELKKRIKAWLTSPSRDFQKVRENLLKQLPDEREEIHVFIQTSHPLLKKLPWSEWDIFSDIYTRAEIALSPPEYSRVKILPDLSRDRVRILAIIGNSAGIDTQTDQKEILALPDAEPMFLEQPQPEELYWQLRDKQGWDILFFAGHSSSSASGDSGQIYINSNSSNNSITIDELKKALQKAIERGLKLAIFNSCDGLGLAKQLADLNFAQVIVMREPVPDAVAQSFVNNFLKAFSNGQPLYPAVREARDSLEAWERKCPGVSWLPVICQNPAQPSATWLRVPDGKKETPPPPDWVMPVPEKETWQCARTIAGHSDIIRTVAISPDGKTLATGSLDKTVKLWNLDTGELIDTIAGHSDPVMSVAFSPDGKTLASSCNMAFQDGTIKLWDADTRKLRQTLGSSLLARRASTLAFSPDGQTLASGHLEGFIIFVGVIYLWDLNTGKVRSTLKGHAWEASSIAFSADGQILVSGGIDGALQIWNWRKEELLNTLNRPSPSDWGGSLISWFDLGPIYSVAISPDGQTVASGGSEQPITLWDTGTGRRLRILMEHSGTVYSLAFSPNGKILASAGEDSTIRIWNYRTGELLHTLKHLGPVRCVTFSPDGQTLVSGSEDRTVKVWRVPS